LATALETSNFWTAYVEWWSTPTPWDNKRTFTYNALNAGLSTALALLGFIPNLAVKLGVGAAELVGRIGLPIVSPAMAVMSRVSNTVYSSGARSLSSLLAYHPNKLGATLGATIALALTYFLGSYTNPFTEYSWTGMIQGLVDLAAGIKPVASMEWASGFTSLLGALGSSLYTPVIVMAGAPIVNLVTSGLLGAYFDSFMLLEPALGQETAATKTWVEGLVGRLERAVGTPRTEGRFSVPGSGLLKNMVSVVGYAGLLSMFLYNVATFGLNGAVATATVKLGEVVSRVTNAVASNGLLSFATLAHLLECMAAYLVFNPLLLTSTALWGSLLVAVGWATSQMLSSFTTGAPLQVVGEDLYQLAGQVASGTPLTIDSAAPAAGWQAAAKAAFGAAFDDGVTIEVVEDIGEDVQGTVGKFATAAADTAKAAGSAVTEAAGSFVDSAKAAGSAVTEAAGSFVDSAKAAGSAVTEAAGSFATTAYNLITRALSAILQWSSTTATTAFRGLIQAIQAIYAYLGNRSALALFVAVIVSGLVYYLVYYRGRAPQRATPNTAPTAPTAPTGPPQQQGKGRQAGQSRGSKQPLSGDIPPVQPQAPELITLQDRVAGLNRLVDIECAAGLIMPQAWRAGTVSFDETRDILEACATLALQAEPGTLSAQLDTWVASALTHLCQIVTAREAVEAAAHSAAYLLSLFNRALNAHTVLPEFVVEGLVASSAEPEWKKYLLTVGRILEQVRQGSVPDWPMREHSPDNAGLFRAGLGGELPPVSLGTMMTDFCGFGARERAVLDEVHYAAEAQRARQRTLIEFVARGAGDGQAAPLTAEYAANTSTDPGTAEAAKRADEAQRLLWPQREPRTLGDLMYRAWRQMCMIERADRINLEGVVDRLEVAIAGGWLDAGEPAHDRKLLGELIREQAHSLNHLYNARSIARLTDLLAKVDEHGPPTSQAPLPDTDTQQPTASQLPALSFALNDYWPNKRTIRDEWFGVWRTMLGFGPSVPLEATVAQLKLALQELERLYNRALAETEFPQSGAQPASDDRAAQMELADIRLSAEMSRVEAKRAFARCLTASRPILTLLAAQGFDTQELESLWGKSPWPANDLAGAASLEGELDRLYSLLQAATVRQLPAPDGGRATANPLIATVVSSEPFETTAYFGLRQYAYSGHERSGPGWDAYIHELHSPELWPQLVRTWEAYRATGTVDVASAAIKCQAIRALCRQHGQFDITFLATLYDMLAWILEHPDASKPIPRLPEWGTPLPSWFAHQRAAFAAAMKVDSALFYTAPRAPQPKSPIPLDTILAIIGIEWAQALARLEKDGSPPATSAYSLVLAQIRAVASLGRHLREIWSPETAWGGKDGRQAVYEDLQRIVSELPSKPPLNPLYADGSKIIVWLGQIVGEFKRASSSLTAEARTQFLGAVEGSSSMFRPATDSVQRAGLAARLIMLKETLPRNRTKFPLPAGPPPIRAASIALQAAAPITQGPTAESIEALLVHLYSYTEAVIALGGAVMHTISAGKPATLQTLLGPVGELGAQLKTKYEPLYGAMATKRGLALTQDTIAMGARELIARGQSTPNSPAPISMYTNVRHLLTYSFDLLRQVRSRQLSPEVEASLDDIARSMAEYQQAAQLVENKLVEEMGA